MSRAHTIVAPGAIDSRQLRRSAAFIGTTTRARRLYRWAGVDLTRIDGVSVGAAQVILTEVGLDLSASNGSQLTQERFRHSGSARPGDGFRVRARLA